MMINKLQIILVQLNSKLNIYYLIYFYIYFYMIMKSQEEKTKY